MGGNEFGKTFRIVTFGESHGKGIGVVIDGVKAGLKISEKDVQRELDRRKPGQSKITTQRKEADSVEIISGVFEGKTLGSPICMLVRNKEFRPQDYDKIKALFRPGHAGYTYFKKFGRQDYRGGGRSSGRETIARVASGAVAKKILSNAGVKVIGYVKEVHGVAAKKIDYKEIEKNIIRSPDKTAAKKMVAEIEKARGRGDSVGGVVEVVVKGLPPGIGEPVFRKLDSELAKAVMSIGAVKGVEFGSGFAVTKLYGSQANDQLESRKGKVKFLSNNSGGILGGISNGDDIVLRIAVKPTSSISKEQKTVNSKMRNARIQTFGRHDPCICPRIVPVAESMVALCLADLYLESKTSK